MSQTYKKFRLVFATLGLVLLAGGTAIADDTELFLGDAGASSSLQAQPNILFIVDTSGSMDTEVETQSNWDPDETFSGCYRSDAVYWSYTNQQPACDSNRWFYASRNYCEDSYSQLNNLGEYSGNALAWRSNWRSRRSRWVALSTRHNRDVECQNDAGEHGNSSGDYWAADGSQGPWSGNSNNEPAWTTNYHLFNGNYLNWLQGDGTVLKERIDIVKDVTTQLLDNLNGVNVGLMRFNYQDGGPVIHAMEDIATAREVMKTEVSNLPADGWTPLSETLYEAGQYYAGRQVVYGDDFSVESVANSRVGGVMSSGTYDSPIEYSCQKNYIVLLTDGEPTRDVGAENRIEGLPGFTSTVGSACVRSPGADDDNGKCLDEMADYMYNYDISSNLDGAQGVTTYTIGFAIDLPVLKSTAERSGGEYYLADDTTTLSSALTKIVVSILDDASTFTAPSVPVNAFNRTQNLDDIFVSVFNPSSTVHWPGNLKKYRLKGGRFFDANDEPAVDPNTGFFGDSSQSLWSAVPDGDRPPAGGAANMLPGYDDRNLYTNIVGNTLYSLGNSIEVDTLAITGAALGGAREDDEDDYTDGLTLSERDRVIEWMRGRDLFDDNDNGEIDDNRNMMGDPLHVRPVPVIYGGTADEPDMVIFVATNDGYLHAINPDTGEEIWSFVPTRMLSRMLSYYQDPVTPDRVYGLDGEITSVVLNDDKIGGISEDERVILIFGMRRGGNAYYAVEVTDRNRPELLWEIDSDTSGFEDLGQTWSTPKFARIRTDNETEPFEDVVFVGGGYDPVQDYDNYRTDNQGNAVYMIDVEDGSRLWSAGNHSDHDLILPEMEHSIPAPLRVVDVNGDDLASRLYFGDMGGRLWRIDLINGNSLDDFAQGGIMAELGAAGLDSPDSADLRRFYNQADVVDVIDGNGNRYTAVNIGSGYRAHPLDRDIDEHFFSVRDFSVNHVLENTDYDDPLLIDDLNSVGSSLSPMGSISNGWKLPMNAASGEKILGRSVTFNGTIYVTSFAPGSSGNACTAVAGQNRLYALSLFGGGSNLPDQPYINLVQGGIAPQVELIFVPDPGEPPHNGGKLIGLVGTEDVELNNIDPFRRSYWSQDGAQ